MSTIIKAGESGPVLRALATVDLADHLSEARDVLRRARLEAARILEEAHRAAAEKSADFNRDLDQTREDAVAEGRREGFSVGREEGRKEGWAAAFQEAREKFAAEQAMAAAELMRATEGLNKLKDELRATAENDLLEFAVLAASKMTFEIGARFNEATMENFRRAIQLVSDRSGITVRVNPRSAEALRELVPDAMAALDHSSAVRVEMDEAMAPGGCVVEGRHTRVDATLESQLVELTQLLLGERADGG
jgi:flagellar assembly protein FliH